MQRITLVITVFLVCLSVSFVSAQTTATAGGEAFLAERTNTTELAHDDWTIYADVDRKVFYVDFESLKVNLSDIVVKDEHGVVMHREDVFELPVNTIYELDFNGYQAGKYDIELRSFTGVIRKSISIK